MSSFRLIYDAEGDILEVDFRLTGEKPERGYEISDNVVIWTDGGINKIHRIMFISYSRLLKRSVVTLKFLGQFPVAEREKIQCVLETGSVSQFLVCHDKQKCQYRLAEPDLTSMVEAA